MSVDTRAFVMVFCILWQGAVPVQQPPKDEKSRAVKSGSAKAEPAKPKRQRVVADLRGFDLLDQPLTVGSVVGATRGSKPPVLYAPRLGKVYDLRPTFTWSYEGRAPRFKFILLDDGQNEIYRAEVRESHFRYPQDAPTLQPGRNYFWTIEAAGTLMSGGSAPLAGLIMLPAAQRTEIENALAQCVASDPYEMALARARVFTDNRFWYDTIAAYSALVEQYPDRAESYEARGMVYAQLAATKSLADADFFRADTLASHAKREK